MAVQREAIPGLRPIDPPQPAPSVMFYDEHSQPTYLGNFHGKVVLLNLWATWCPPCVMEMPSLNKLQRRYKRSGLEVVAIAQEKSADVVRRFMAENKLRYLPTYFDPNSMVGPSFSTQSLPTSFLINRKGEIVARMDAADDWFSPELRAKIEDALKQDLPQNVELPALHIKDAPKKSGGIHY